MEGEAQCSMLSTTCGHLSGVRHVCFLGEYNSLEVLRPEGLNEKQKTVVICREETGIKEEIKVYLHRLTNIQKKMDPYIS